MKIPEREEEENGIKSILKAIIAENFSNLGRKIDL